MRKVIKLDWNDVILEDIKFFSEYCDEIVVFGDEMCVVIVNPSPILLKELDKRGIKYEILDEGD